TLRNARQTFRGALDGLHSLPDPATFHPGILHELSRCVEQVARAISEVPPQLAAGKEWQTELRQYRDTLRELHDELSKLETHLRVRRAQMAKARTHLDAAQNWANLVQRIG
ncbi:MAG: hypothetical protein ACRD4M_12425, partial [Candidatus Acidiferrales bacterium]